MPFLTGIELVKTGIVCQEQTRYGRVKGTDCSMQGACDRYCKSYPGIPSRGKLPKLSGSLYIALVVICPAI